MGMFLSSPLWSTPLPMLSLKRCVHVGAFVREAIEWRPEQKRVAVIGTGGLSHWVGLPETDKVNADFDRWFLDCLVAGKREEVITNWLWHRSDNVGRSVKGVFDKDLASEPPARAQWCRYRIPPARARMTIPYI
jgi:catalytic LigB subunit of aromatic ring-opening dioxygenase